MILHLPQVTHITPVNDFREHTETSDGECWCRPRQEKVDNVLVYFHHAEDGREVPDDDEFIDRDP